jgi:hypothetical protein
MLLADAKISPGTKGPAPDFLGRTAHELLSACATTHHGRAKVPILFTRT